ncbi:protein phosphatase 1 regulatory subunit SDS22-like protein [Corchorus olitorius]|uniref:Protein phosphatase 1 regulatory subunit SDS22-like protein n=1 Tax=Corchorus olitorius TaxID=93759 RepID=A0A1R3KW21_9ROSI|nr:protein phosphatase 1 regulatory subunit SDS22-like protein [Corchorus olitorius]
MDTVINNAKGLDDEKELKKKRKKRKNSKDEPENDNKIGNTLEEKPKKKKSEKRAELDIIDDGGTSFAELITIDVAGPEDDGKRNMLEIGICSCLMSN